MKIIVRCESCSRKYNAGNHKPGKCFRCRCGSLLTIPNPPSKFEAKVVRCSSCGAPRKEGSSSCEFCGSDFTLHEKDMHTVCPCCMTRISDKAKFCHHCGERIIIEENAGEQSDIPCPSCGKEKLLQIRKLPGRSMTFMECVSCGGMWLGHEVFQELKKESIHGSSIELKKERKDTASLKEGLKKQEGNLYRRCPTCNMYMARRNFEQKSGVIIDICNDHGIWFDNDELNRLLAWIGKGGLKNADTSKLREKTHQGKKHEQTDTGSVVTYGGDYYDSHDTSFTLGTIVGGIFTGLGSAFVDGIIDAGGGDGGGGE